MFIERPRTNRKRVKIYGIGINDAEYVTYNTNNEGTREQCPFITRWKSMFVRSYSDNYHIKYPSYKGCSVAPSWHKLSDFRLWMKEQNWHDRHLDKDLKIPGNKLYSPDTCIFVPPDVNGLFTGYKEVRSKYPVGVCLHKYEQRFTAVCCLNGKQKHLGYFDTPNDASRAYIKAKVDRIMTLASKYKDDKEITDLLLMHADIIRVSI